MTRNVEHAVKSIQEKININPKIGLVLGSGLGSIAESLENKTVVDYKEIEGMPLSSAPGHKGRFVFGKLADMPIACMQGRFHLYEGYDVKDVVFPIHVMASLGIEILIVTNAAGGINLNFKCGDIMLIEDHINFLGVNPLTGTNNDDLGVRFPDMTTAYDSELRAIASSVADEESIELKHGVYIATPGPSFETPAEIKAFGILGADAVGMSTVPEVIAARHLQIRVLGLTMISNLAAGLAGKELTSEDVNQAAQSCSHKISTIIKGVIKKL